MRSTQWKHCDEQTIDILGTVQFVIKWLNKVFPILG